MTTLDMPRISRAVITAVIAGCVPMAAQVAPPKHESNSEHVKQSRAQNYSQRYNELRCAMVTISWEETVSLPITVVGQQPQPVKMKHFGSGFYASADGDIVTAAHVVGNKSWSDPGTGMVVSVATPDSWTVVNSHNESQQIPREKLEQSPDAWGADLATIKSGSKPPCWLEQGDGSSVQTGQHVITLGFPGLSFGSLSIYTGIVSARLKLDLMIGITIQGKPVKPENDFFRVQMPISTGLSGAAVIDDDNRAIAVVSSAGASSPLLDTLIGVASTQDLMMTQTPSGQNRNIDWPWAVGELAKSLREYASPGYGDSVPLSYLKAEKPVPTRREASPRDHQQLQDHPK